MKGVVKKVVMDKGFGFIKGVDGKEYFFHRSSVRGDFDNVHEGMDVQFELETSPKGPRARDVTAG